MWTDDSSGGRAERVGLREPEACLTEGGIYSARLFSSFPRKREHQCVCDLHKTHLGPSSAFTDMHEQELNACGDPEAGLLSAEWADAAREG